MLRQQALARLMEAIPVEARPTQSEPHRRGTVLYRPGESGAWSSSSTALSNSYGFAMRPGPAGMVSTAN